MKDTMVGVDLAKNVFQLHGASMARHVKFRKKVTQIQFRNFMAKHEPAVVVMEAWGASRKPARPTSADHRSHVPPESIGPKIDSGGVIVA